MSIITNPSTHSTFDLPLAAAEQRMADLRADARPDRALVVGPGRLAWARRASGHRLIALGSALAVGARSRTSPALAMVVVFAWLG